MCQLEQRGKEGFINIRRIFLSGSIMTEDRPNYNSLLKECFGYEVPGGQIADSLAFNIRGPKGSIAEEFFVAEAELPGPAEEAVINVLGKYRLSISGKEITYTTYDRGTIIHTATIHTSDEGHVDKIRAALRDEYEAIKERDGIC